MKILPPLILMAIVIVSCQKESSTEPPSNGGNGNNPPPNDSTLLWKYIETDPTLPAGSDTTLQVIYTYDNKKRLSSYHTNFYYGAEQTVDLFYSGNDTLPYKSTSISTSNGDVYRDTVFYSYLNGFVNKDSTVEYNGSTNQLIEISAFEYTPDGNNTLFQYRHYSSPSTMSPDDELNFTLFKTYQGDNITMQEDTSSVVLFSWAHEQVSYDDKINPFYEVTPVNYSVLGPWLNAQKNNPVDDISWDTPSQPEHLIYTYTYRADGRPLSVAVTGPADEWKGIFLYTK